MTFAELLAEVYLITNRPDLINQTKSAIKAATLKMHGIDFFSKDIYETGVDLESEALIHSWDYVTLIPNFRSFSYVNRLIDSADTNGVPINILTPTDLLDEYGATKPNIAYVAGRSLEMRSQVAFRYLTIGVYVYPVVTELNYVSWIADQFPYAIIYEAASKIWRSVGGAEEARLQDINSKEIQFQIITSASTNVGF